MPTKFTCIKIDVGNQQVMFPTSFFLLLFGSCDAVSEKKKKSFGTAFLVSTSASTLPAPSIQGFFSASGVNNIISVFGSKAPSALPYCSCTVRLFYAVNRVSAYCRVLLGAVKKIVIVHARETQTSLQMGTPEILHRMRCE